MGGGRCEFGPSPCSVLLMLAGYCATAAGAQDSPLDQKVRRFLESRRGSWRDMNVPWQDGQLLHDLIVKHRFKRALEIGTSTGHSGDLDRVGAREDRRQADHDRDRPGPPRGGASRTSRRPASRRSSTRASPTRTSSCKQLPGPFDFVFSDADKGWYTQYFKDVEPKLEVGGCFTAHNIAWRSGGPGEFLDYVRALPNYDTTVEGSGEGVSISCKR